jgi:hypothetical protein
MISCSKRGVCIEYLAVNLFLEAGFEVFVNAAPDGPADLMVWDGTNAYPIDTKKVNKYIHVNGSGCGYSYSKSTFKPGVIYLGYCNGEWIWLSDVPQSLSEAVQVDLTYIRS